MFYRLSFASMIMLASNLAFGYKNLRYSFDANKRVFCIAIESECLFDPIFKTENIVSAKAENLSYDILAENTRGRKVIHLHGLVDLSKTLVDQIMLPSLTYKLSYNLTRTINGKEISFDRPSIIYLNDELNSYNYMDLFSHSFGFFEGVSLSFKNSDLSKEWYLINKNLNASKKIHDFERWVLEILLEKKRASLAEIQDYMQEKSFADDSKWSEFLVRSLMENLEEHFAEVGRGDIKILSNSAEYYLKSLKN